MLPLVLTAVVALGQAATACEPLRVGEIALRLHDVFELGDESGWLVRTANRLHIRTREHVVRRELLFRPGEILDLEAIRESERNLRAQPYLRDASITVSRSDGEPIDHRAEGSTTVCSSAGAGTATVTVVTRDAWTTSIDGRARKSGDRFTWGIGLEETNLLGLGKRVRLSHTVDLERTSDRIEFRDPRLAGSRYILAAELSNQSDGRKAVLAVERPFFSISTAWSMSSRLETFDQTQALYAAGEEVDRLRHLRRRAEIGLSKALSRNASSASRFHVAYRHLHDEVGVETRRFGVVQVGISHVANRFIKLTHVDHERAVDLNLGGESQLHLGISSAATGGRDGTAVFVTAEHRQGADLGGGRFLLGGARWDGRVQGGRVRNGLLDAQLTLVDSSRARRVFLLGARLRYGVRLDPEVQISLGADRGLRGYPVHQFVGDRALVFTAERRWFLLDDLARLASLGVALYADSGYAWAPGQSVDLGDLRTNIGVGLIIGRTRLSLRNATMRVDLSYALDPVEGHGRWLLSFGSGRPIR